MALEQVSAPIAAGPELPTSLASAFSQAQSAKSAPQAPASEPSAPAAEAQAVKTPASEPAKAKVAASPLDALNGDTPTEEPSNKLPIDDIGKENKPEPTEEPVKDLKAGKRIQELKEEIKTSYKPRITELESKVSQYEARIQELEGFSTESEALKQKLADYEAEMSVVKLERTEAYQEKVTKPLSEISSRAGEIADAYGIDRNKLFDAMEQATPAARKQALKAALSGLDVDGGDSYELHKLADDTATILGKRDELYANADKALAELEARKGMETQAQAAERAKERIKTTEMVSDRIVAKMPFLKDVIGEVSNATKNTDFGSLDTANQAYSHMAGHLLPKLVAMYNAKQEELDAALDASSAYQKAAPTLGGQAPAGAPKELPSSLASAVSAGLRR